MKQANFRFWKHTFGYAIVEFLGYNQPAHAIKNHVRSQKEIEKKLRGVRSNTLHDVIKHRRVAAEVATKYGVYHRGVYALIMRSKLPEVEKFQRWLFEDVLPQVRRKGEYRAITPTSTVATYDATLVEAQILLQLQLQHSQTVAKYDPQLAELTAVNAL